MKASLKVLIPLVVVALIGTGCGGFRGSQTVSPMTFLVPLLIKNDCPQCPTTNEVVVVMEDSTALASAR